MQPSYTAPVLLAACCLLLTTYLLLTGGLGEVDRVSKEEDGQHNGQQLPHLQPANISIGSSRMPSLRFLAWCSGVRLGSSFETDATPVSPRSTSYATYLLTYLLGYALRTVWMVANTSGP
jgi:hypothetical protein